MSPDSIVGTCTWDACKKCGLYREKEGCTYYNPTFVVKEGNVYCLEYGEVKK